MKTKTLFIGSGVFAVEILKGLLSSPAVELSRIVTQPDKPTGRKMVITPCPVGEYIQKTDLDRNIKIFKPEKIRSICTSIINEVNPELIIVADYGQIIPEEIINFPKYKCLNVHGSLLPDLRGAVPIPMAILKGYKETGVSIPIMTNKIDDGDILASGTLEIMPDDTTFTLKKRLAILGAELLVKTIPDWVTGNIRPIKQDESKATYCWQREIAKELALLTPNLPADKADKMIRAFYPWPIAWCKVLDENGQTKMVKIISASLSKSLSEVHSGRFTKTDKALTLTLDRGTLVINKIQMEGKPVMDGRQALFLVGKSIEN